MPWAALIKVADKPRRKIEMSLRVKTLDIAVAEAKRFLEAAAVGKRAAASTEYTNGDPWYCGGQYCAAAKRASMDLSKALAAVRRGS